MEASDYRPDRLRMLTRVHNGGVFYPPPCAGTKRGWLTRGQQPSLAERKVLTELLTAGLVTIRNDRQWHAEISHEGRRVLGDWEVIHRENAKKLFGKKG